MGQRDIDLILMAAEGPLITARPGSNGGEEPLPEPTGDEERLTIETSNEIVKHWRKCLLILVGVVAVCLTAYFVWKLSSNATDTNVVNNSPNGINIKGTTSPSTTANWILCNGKEIANFLKEMTHNDSLHKCNRIGGRLPTKDEIQNMTPCIKHGEDYHIQQHSPIQDGQCEFYNTDSKDPVKLACDTTRFLVCRKQLASSGTSESSKKY